ncbi:MAG TPA: hypothetical protein VFE47_31720 [Tepidisphaeraceae bacterium]|nr:hypothetical protein [Tepidisphaeraceae bacterium]
MTFQGVGLNDAIDFLRDMGAGVEVDWKEIEAAGIDRNAPITASLVNEPFSTLLLRIVQQSNLAFSAKDGLIRISTRQHLLKAHGEYRQRWPFPSDDDLAATESLRVWLTWAPSALEIERHEKRNGPKPPPPPSPPQSDEISDVFDALADAMHVPIDVKWSTLSQFGITPETRVNSLLTGTSANWVGEVIQQVSSGQDVQYQLRGGRIIVTSREWFDDQDLPIVRAVETGGLGLLALWLVVLLMFVRRRRSLGMFWFFTVVLVGAVVALLVARTRVPEIHLRGGDRSYTLEMADNDTLAFRIRPLVLSDAASYRYAMAATPITLFSRWQTSLIRTGTFNSEIRAATLCMPIVCLLLVLPGCWLMLRSGNAIRSARRRAQGRCINCGYDLRFSKAKCPECGAIA